MSLRLRAAVANLREHAIVQQMRARCAETTVKKLEGDVAKLNAALFSARTKLISWGVGGPFLTLVVSIWIMNFLIKTEPEHWRPAF